jgi:short-subunit dehydrogenase
MSRGGRTLFWLGVGCGAIAVARSIARQKRRTYFAGRTVLITGGSRGLGLEMARLFAAEGAYLALLARDANELERAQTHLNSFHTEVFTAVCDITDRQAVEAAVARVKAHYGKIDVLINNAGVIAVGPMETMTLDDYRVAMETHFWAPLYTTLAVLPDMRTRKGGRIVNISSIGGKISVPHLLPYSASKRALTGLSEGMRSELMQDGVYVTTVCPGLMRTGSHVNATFKGQNQLEYAWFSIGNALPFSSTDAEQAARQIVNACRYGDAELVVGLPAQAAALVHGLFPGATVDLFGVYNRFLPGPGGIGEAHASGKESQTALSPSPLTALSDRAVGHNNEF